MAKQVAAPLMVVALLGGGGAAYMSLDQKKDSDAEVTKEAAPSKEKKGKDRKKKTSPKRTTSILRIPVAIATKDMEAVVDAELPQQIMSRKGQVLAKDLTVDYEVERVGKVSVTTRKGRVNVEVPVQMRGTAYVKRLLVS